MRKITSFDRYTLEKELRKYCDVSDDALNMMLKTDLIDELHNLGVERIE